MERSYLRGHAIEYLDGEWVYSDTKQPSAQTFQDRPCGHCDRYNTKEGHDGCLGTLPGVMNACCGHGQCNDAYVQFLDGFSVHGEDAVTMLNALCKAKDRWYALNDHDRFISLSEEMRKALYEMLNAMGIYRISDWILSRLVRCIEKIRSLKGEGQ